jgi:hypothetical protein
MFSVVILLLVLQNLQSFHLIQIFLCHVERVDIEDVDIHFLVFGYRREDQHLLKHDAMNDQVLLLIYKIQ